MHSSNYIHETSFKEWARQNKNTLLVAGCLVLIQFFVFKLFYPFPNFLPDSYSYIEAAEQGKHINIWPIGYSRVLWLLRAITRNHMYIVWLQYLILQVAIFYLLYTMDFFWTPRRWIANVILFSTLCNPLILHISNFISSDALFAALSLCWFTQLLWLIYNPTVRLLLLHSLILLLAFTVRYNALYYPIISLGILLLLNIRLGRKLIGISAISILLGSFIGYTQYRFQKETGVAQFSPFGGWQLATNALFAYGHVSPNERTLPPKKFKKLQTIVDKHIDSFQILLQTSDNKLGIYYLWNPRSPLRQYMRQKFLRDSTTRGFKQWALIAPMYKEYGYYLTNQYKGIFLKKYIWPNLVHYYSPPSEFLANYNMGKDTIEQTAVAWFGLNNNKIHSYFTDKKISLTEYIPIALAIINLVFIGSIIGFTWLGGFNATESLNKRTLKLMLIVWTSNMLFSVIASPIVLRYQVFPMIIAEIFLVYLLDFIIQKSKSCQSFSIINKPETVVTLEVMRNEV